MIKGGGFPGCGRMAQRAIGAVLSFMEIVFFMTGYTIRGGTLEHTCSVTAVTFGLQVLAHQLELRIGVVIEIGRLPALWIVADCAVG